MIKSPRPHNTQLRSIYKDSNPCDTVNFSQNIEMCTNQDYTFGRTQGIKKTFLEEKIQFYQYMDTFTKYVQKQTRQASLGKVNYKFKKFEYQIGDADQDNNQEKTPFESSLVIKNKQKQSKPPHFDFAKINQKFIKNIPQQKKVIKSSMQLKDIQSIGTQQFKTKCENYEDFDHIIDIMKPIEVKDVKSRDLVDELRRYRQFKILSKDKGVYGTSTQIHSIDILNGVKVTKFKNQKMPMPQSLQQNSINKDHLLSFAKFSYRYDELLTHLLHKKQLKKQQQILQKDDDVEQKLLKIKKDIKILKEKLKKKHNNNTKEHQTQTQKLITFEYIKDLISIEDQALIFRISELLIMKDSQIKQSINPISVYERIHPLMNKTLFSLLVLIASGQNYVSWSDFMLMDDVNEVQKILLDNGKTCSNGRSKVQLLNLYCKMKFMIHEEGGEIFNQYEKLIVEQKHKNKYQFTLTPNKNSKKRNFNMSTSIDRSSHFISTQKNLKSFDRSIKNFNDTTKQNTTNFNRTKNSVRGQSMQNRIDNLFQSTSSPFAKRSINFSSKSPIASKNGNSISNKKNITPSKPVFKTSKNIKKNNYA